MILSSFRNKDVYHKKNSSLFKSKGRQAIASHNDAKTYKKKNNSTKVDLKHSARTYEYNDPVAAAQSQEQRDLI